MKREKMEETEISKLLDDFYQADTLLAATPETDPKHKKLQAVWDDINGKLDTLLEIAIRRIKLPGESNGDFS
jgi:hypothetical protein